MQVPLIRFLLLLQKKSSLQHPRSSVYKCHTYEVPRHRGTFYAGKHTGAFYQGSCSPCRSDCDKHSKKHCLHQPHTPERKRIFLLLREIPAALHYRSKGLQMYSETVCRSDINSRMHLCAHVCLQTVKTVRNDRV